MDTTQIKKIIEAALLASSQPMSVPQLEALFGGDQDDPVGHEQVAGALEALGADCGERGIELVEVASGFRFQVRRDIHPWVARMWTERPSRYSRALLETLALIAYRQPITRGEIEQVRGVAVSTHIIKTLEEREWIRVVGHRDSPGRPALFGTTRTFLDYFNLKSLDELPPLADILNLDDMDPQLAFDDKSAQVGPPAAADAPAGAEAETEAATGIDAGDAPAAEQADETGVPAGETDGETGDDETAPGPLPETGTAADAADDDTLDADEANPEEDRA